MAHRPGSEYASEALEVTVRLVDVEPVAGLVAAVGRFCAHLDAQSVQAMPEPAARALSQIQAIMYALENSRPEGGE